MRCPEPDRTRFPPCQIDSRPFASFVGALRVIPAGTSCLVTGIHGKEIFSGIRHRTSLLQKTTYALLGAGSLSLGAYLLVHVQAFRGVYSPLEYPGALATGIFFLLLATAFLALASEDHFPTVHKYLMMPWVNLTLSISGVSSIGELGAKYPIDSDVALCFYLAQGYRSKFNTYKRITLAVMLVIIPLLMTFVELPGTWAASLGTFNRAVGYDPAGFLVSQIVTIILLVLKVAQALKPPAIDVDFKIAKTTRELDAEPTLRDELMSLLSVSRMVVEQEACHFVGDFRVENGVCLQKKPENRHVTRPRNQGTHRV